MTLTEAQVKALTDTELSDLFPLVQAEWTSRQRAAISEQTIDAALIDVHSGEVSGDPWVQPVSLAKGYPKGAIRTHATKSWISNDYANVTEPGQPGALWTEITGTYPEWDDEQIYGRGVMVAHLGVVYVSTRSSNTTEPGTNAGRLHWSIAEGITP